MRKRTQKIKAFSLLEVVIALGAFLVIMGGTIQIMAQGTRSYKAMKVMQSNLESVQFALSVLIKELRTSSVVARSLGASSSTMTIFDYSQNRCIQYQADETTGHFSRRAHGFGSADPDANRASCLAYASSFTESYETLLTGLTSQSFYVDPSTLSPLHVGRVTVRLSVGLASAQTTVSLRDFNYIGL